MYFYILEYDSSTTVSTCNDQCIAVSSFVMRLYKKAKKNILTYAHETY